MPIIAAAVRPDPADAPYASGGGAAGWGGVARGAGRGGRAAGGDGTGWVAAAVCTFAAIAEATSPIARGGGRSGSGLGSSAASSARAGSGPALPVES